MKRLKGNTILKKEEALKRKVIEMEMDYELLTLFEAIQQGDEISKDTTIQRLNDLRKELLSLSI